MKPKIKPRNPFVALTKFRKAGAHTKPAKSLRRHEKQAIAKAAKQSPESCHNRVAHQFGSVMALVDRFLWIRTMQWRRRLLLMCGRCECNQLSRARQFVVAYLLARQ